MLDANTWRTTIDILGVPASFQQAKPPATTVPLSKVGFATVAGDEELINALGLNGRKITIKASDLGTVVPAKFDTVTVAGKGYVIDSSHAILEPGTGAVIGYKCLCKGAG